jgi:hypothetical protein
MYKYLPSGAEMVGPKIFQPKKTAAASTISIIDQTIFFFKI